MCISNCVISVGFTTQSLCDVCGMYDHYYKELSCLVNRHAPLAAWCQELGELKRQVCLRERTWRRSRIDDHRVSYTKLRDQYCRTLASTKAAFHSKEVESASNENRAMFCIANHLLDRKCMKLLPNVS